MKSTKYHQPVMVKEVLKFLKLDAHLNTQASREIKIIDATLGFGGHSLEILKKGARVLGIETDKKALKAARERLSRFQPRIAAVHGNFRDINKIALKKGFSRVDGIFFDLGVNIDQLKSTTRGFSFGNDSAALDMRLDKTEQHLTAADLLNSLRKDQLKKLFEKTLAFRETKTLIKRIIVFREQRKIKTVGDFLEIVGKKIKRGKIHPATRAFLALRMATNSELENLKEALPRAFGLLKTKGRLVVISFHSSEDKVVKDFYKNLSVEKRGEMLTKGPIGPSLLEVGENKRARSAKMRVIEKKDK